MSTDTAVAKDQLKSVIERIENLESEKKSIQEDIKEVYSEAKGNGFDTKVLRQIVKDRKKDRAERQEFDSIYELYSEAIGL